MSSEVQLVLFYMEVECNLYYGFCKDAGILNPPPIPESCSECIWKQSCEADKWYPDGAWNPAYDFDELFEAEFHVEEFKWWREFHPKLVRRKPKDPLKYRCNRCFSTNIDWSDPEWIKCRNCNWAEPLHDYPVARRYYEQSRTSPTTHRTPRSSR